MTSVPSSELRDRIAAALRNAAHDCDGDCGLTETDCFEQHPIQVSVIHFDQIAGVYGYIDALAAVGAEAVQPELDRLRAELEQARQQTADRITAGLTAIHDDPATADTYRPGLRRALRSVHRLVAQPTT